MLSAAVLAGALCASPASHSDPAGHEFHPSTALSLHSLRLSGPETLDFDRRFSLNTTPLSGTRREVGLSVRERGVLDRVRVWYEGVFGDGPCRLSPWNGKGVAVRCGD